MGFVGLKFKKKLQFCELGWNFAQYGSGGMKNTIQQVIKWALVFGSKCYLKIQGVFMN